MDFRRRVLESKIPVLVDFFAEWCPPCRTMAPVLEELAREYAGRVKVVKVNVEEEPRLAGEYGIMSLPTLMMFRGGEMVDMVVGAQPKGVVAERLQELVG
jgi:thioredoxin 1